MEIIYSEKAIKQIKYIYKSQKYIAELIIKKIENINNETNNIKSLKGKLGDILRLRVGDYRILFVKELINEITIIKILEINHRKEVYRDN